MKCPKCKSAKRGVVSATRYIDFSNSIRRIRTCGDCGHKYITFERESDEELGVNWTHDRKRKKEYFKKILLDLIDAL
tara:strand:+ start:50 stop:280 length:231 start_codon:yes stop_codon:yes gene_type:complete